MTKEEIISILKQKKLNAEEESKKQHKGTLNQTAISSFESGIARGIEIAISIIGMLDNKHNKTNENRNNH